MSIDIQIDPISPSNTNLVIWICTRCGDIHKDGFKIWMPEGTKYIKYLCYECRIENPGTVQRIHSNIYETFDIFQNKIGEKEW